MQCGIQMVNDDLCARRTIERVPSDFENTRWSIIARAASADESTRREALDAFVRIYRPACVGFLRQRGFQAEFADEVTQGFFTDVVLARNLLHGAAPDKGRLRSLIRRALENYARDTLRRGMARGRHEAHAARDADDAAQGGMHGERGIAPGFDGEWARAQLTEAIHRVRERCSTEAHRQGWTIFERAVLLPCVYGTARPEMRDVAAEAGVSDAARGHVLLRETRMRVLQSLEEVVAETIDQPGECEGEVAYIRELLSAFEL